MANKTRTTYQIIDTIPDVIRTTIPLVDIITVGVYFTTSSLQLGYDIIKDIKGSKKLFSKKTERMKGKDIELEKIIILSDVEKKLREREQVLETIKSHFVKKEAYELLEELSEQGYYFDKSRLSKSFSIVRKIEVVKNAKDLKTRVVYAYPEHANTIAKIFGTKKIKSFVKSNLTKK